MMAKFEIKIDLKQFDKVIETTKEQIKEGIEQGLLVCAKEVQQVERRFIELTTGKGKYTPTGQLKNSITIMPIQWSPYSASITIEPTGSGADYARFVNEGTGEHHPQGRDGGWYYTPDEGVTWYFTWGIRPHYFIDKTYDYIKPKAKPIIEEQIYKCIR